MFRYGDSHVKINEKTWYFKTYIIDKIVIHINMAYQIIILNRMLFVKLLFRKWKGSFIMLVKNTRFT